MKINEEKKIIRISAFVAIAGLFLLYVSLTFYTPEEKKIGEINGKDIGEYFIICGNITDYKQYEKIGKGIICDEKCMVVVSFKQDLKELKDVCIQGYITRYKGELEFIAETKV